MAYQPSGIEAVHRPAFAVRFLRLLALLSCLLILSAGCSGESSGKDKKKEQRKRPDTPVTIDISKKKTIPVEIAATGHIEAPATVGIRSQVTGVLKSVHFQEGDDIKKGDLLFTIDPRPFAANLAKATAGLAKDKAELENGQRELDRYTLAVKKGFVSNEQADQAATRVATLTATIKADQAEVDAARLELEYCTIHSPIDGRTGDILTDQGNLIKANADTPMVTINQMVPVLASFTVPGRNLQEINKYQMTGPLPVLAGNPNSGEPLNGSLAFIDNTVDPTTGVIRLKAIFANTGKTLWPGQMIDVRVLLASRPDCIVVPSHAIQTGQKGAYVYVVREDQTVEYRPVKPGTPYNGETVIEDGMREGERVVTDGQMQLADGARVQERGSQTGNKPAKEKARGNQ